MLVDNLFCQSSTNETRSQRTNQLNGASDSKAANNILRNINNSFNTTTSTSSTNLTSSNIG